MMNSKCDVNGVNSFDGDQCTYDESTGVTMLSEEQSLIGECVDSAERSHQVTGPGQSEMAPVGKILFTNDTETNNQPVCFSELKYINVTCEGLSLSLH